MAMGRRKTQQSHLFLPTAKGGGHRFYEALDKLSAAATKVLVQRKNLVLLAVSILLPVLVFGPAALFGEELFYALRPRLVATTFVGSFGSFVVAVRGLWRDAKADPDPARAKRHLAYLGVGIVVAGVGISGAIFGYYSHAYDQARASCEVARSAPTLSERRAAVKAAAPARARTAFFNESVFSCEEAERELDALSRGECPRLPPDDVACRCGAQKFPVDWAGKSGRPRCDSFDDNGNVAKSPRLHARATWDPP